MSLGAPELLIVLAVVMLLFGAKRSLTWPVPSARPSASSSRRPAIPAPEDVPPDISTTRIVL